MNHELLEQYTATGLADLIAKREISPVELVEAYLERIARFDPLLSAYITVCGELALVEARVAEKAVLDGEPLGALHGLPLAVKDQFETAQICTTAGSTILADYIPTEDATLVARARDAGAIFLGKLNMTEFAAGLGDRFKYGEPRNPWDVTRSTSGSSTGSAIAIAASLCALSLGEDTGGSIRLPAALAGIVGVRPSWGLLSRHGILPICWSMDAAGPMTRTVSDAALLLNAIAGYDSKDPLSSRRPVPDYRDSLIPELKGVRIALVKELLDEDFFSSEVVSAVRSAASQMQALGAEVTEISVPALDDMAPAMAIITGSHGAYVHRKWLLSQPEKFGPTLRRGWLAASLYPAQALHKANHLRSMFQQDWRAIFDNYDALLSPTTQEVAQKISYRETITSYDDAQQRPTWRRSATMAAALAGTPAMTIPCGFDHQQLPIGLQIMAGRFREDIMFRVGYAYEQCTNWHKRRPNLSVQEASSSCNGN